MEIILIISLIFWLIGMIITLLSYVPISFKGFKAIDSLLIFGSWITIICMLITFYKLNKKQ